ncbi:hypothetical protein AABB24_020857 [Solanum stoloniferum]|uniref:Serine/threonine-protein phosphatase n=1 Tax=Solanum stoloniferum TaxID=62892 RepID=A0ABD2TA02_9SOLN
MLYQYGIKLRQQPTTEVAGRNVMEMCTDGLIAADEAQRLTVLPSYVPKQPGNSSNSRRRGRAGGRGKQRGTTTTTNVAESPSTEDANPDVVSPMEDANPDVVSPMEDANPNVEPDCGTSTGVMGGNLNDEAQFGMGSSPCDDVPGSHYFHNQIVIYNAKSSPMEDANPDLVPPMEDANLDVVPPMEDADPELVSPMEDVNLDMDYRSSQIVIYNAQPLRQFANDDVGYASPPEQVESMNDDLEEQVFSFRGSTVSTSLPSTPIPSLPQIPIPQIPISWPEDGTLTLGWVTNLMLAFNWASWNLPPSHFPLVLPVETFDHLILMASELLHKEPNCVKIDGLGPNSKVVVVGEVHGQLHDLLFLLRDVGFPSKDQYVVFNGDYVDKGAWGLETFFLLLAWKVLMPGRVFLLRGNHESKYCTAIYGVQKEVTTKYGDEGKHVYERCLGCFKELPLASIIGNRVYTAHGGVFRNISAIPYKRAEGKKSRKIVADRDSSDLRLGSLKELQKARRSVLDPSPDGTNVIPGDVMWSDPQMENGLSLNKGRGIGLKWGPDCTEDFLQKFNLKLIIRSHEGPDAREKNPELGKMDKGYNIDHEVTSGKLITLFSAPDYPQFQATENRYGNEGAYIVLEPPNFDNPSFHCFKAVLPRPKVDAYYDYVNEADSDEELDLSSMVT